MRLILSTLLCLITLCSFACQPQDKRIDLQEGVGNDTLLVNIVTKPVIGAFMALAGQGIEINKAVTYVNKDGFMELDVSGYNNTITTKRFEYKVDWLDKDGIVIDSATNKWMLFSAAERNPFSIKAVAPRTDAVNFRMLTRKAQD
jgi:hypothetical protein